MFVSLPVATITFLPVPPERKEWAIRTSSNNQAQFVELVLSYFLQLSLEAFIQFVYTSRVVGSRSSTPTLHTHTPPPHYEASIIHYQSQEVFSSPWTWFTEALSFLSQKIMSHQHPISVTKTVKAAIWFCPTFGLACYCSLGACREHKAFVTEPTDWAAHSTASITNISMLTSGCPGPQVQEGKWRNQMDTCLCSGLCYKTGLQESSNL